MNMDMNNILQRETVQAVHCDEKDCQPREQDLIGEEPLSILVEDEPYSVVMRTPGEEIFHVAGFCLAEGLLDRREDVATLGYCEDMDPNVISVTLNPARKKEVSSLLDRRGFISQTSCGICGKEMVKDLCQTLTPIQDEAKIDLTKAIATACRLDDYQELYEMTRGSHAVLIFDSQFEMLAMAEDVGRHNALDKAIGKLFMSGQLEKARLAVLSSRISYELVQKAARAQLPIMISHSRPTALAVELGQSLNMTLACLGDDSGLLVFCGEERLINQ
jgi:FdhD protein